MTKPQRQSQTTAENDPALKVAREKINNDENESALEDLDKILAEKPDYAEAYFYRGNAHANLQEIDEALEDYEQALQLDSEFVDVYISRGVVHFVTGNIDESENDFTQAIELAPESDGLPYNNRGVVHFVRKQYQLALADYRKADELTPNEPMTVGGLAVTYHALKKKKKAFDNWRRLVQMDSQFQDAEWAGEALNWPPELIIEAQKLTRKL